jgi:hypothetical protein
MTAFGWNPTPVIASDPTDTLPMKLPTFAESAIAAPESYVSV